MKLADILPHLEAFAPLRLAGSWDNVGLLLEGERPVQRVGLCIDLTEAVADELLGAEVDLIVSYHPPIFGGVKRLTLATPRDRTLLRLIRAGVHLWSPHSALDAAADGMAEWLLEPFGAGDACPILPDRLDPTLGAGRLATLVMPRPLSELLPAIRRHLGLEGVRVAGSIDRPLRTVAVCPGAGGSVFQGVEADLLFTGEMRHHDVLAQVERGGVVLLTDHTNTERGYLSRLQPRIEAALGLPVLRSMVDHDPLRIV